MKTIRLIFLCCVMFRFAAFSQNSLRFNSIDSLFRYAEDHSAAIKTADQQSLLAKSIKLAALGNIANLKAPISASWTDNTELPVSYVPAEFFGGPAGTLKELSFGQEYVTNYGITPQIDIISPAAWARVKSASINSKLTETINLINKKTLFESISATYYNILSLQAQTETLKENVKAADSIFSISTNKFSLGLIREQDKNTAEINLLNVQDKLVQLNSTLEQQYNTLKLLCDISPATSVTIEEKTSVQTTAAPASKSGLYEKQQQLQSAYMRSELRANRLLTFSPTLSFVFNQAWQQSSNSSFFDENANHFSTQYFGLKLSIPLPFDVNHLSQTYTSRINYTISKLNAEHGALQNQISNTQLDLDYQKALSAYTNAKKVAALRESNYSKSLNQFKEGILSTENLLLAFTEHVNAKLNLISAENTLNYTVQKIKINNSIQ
jgi:outer membrane protein TolC